MAAADKAAKAARLEARAEARAAEEERERAARAAWSERLHADAAEAAAPFAATSRSIDLTLEAIVRNDAEKFEGSLLFREQFFAGKGQSHPFVSVAELRESWQ